ncbi:MAG: hypothetical protein KQH83_02800 [Actinobacteria bacterium]|nr:hypothetical protein [Actinomycetota bacterium]
MGAVAAGAILFAVLLLAVAVLVWQSGRVGGPERATYLVPQAIEFVHGGLPADAAARLDAGDVRRILEWSRYHSQVVVPRSAEGIAVIGGPAAAAYVAEQAAAEGRRYDDGDLRLVLDLEAAYLVSIGAVGEIVEEEAP